MSQIKIGQNAANSGYGYSAVKGYQNKQAGNSFADLLEKSGLKEEDLRNTVNKNQINEDLRNAIQGKKDAKADAKARLEARQRASKANGHVTYKDPTSGKYVSGTPEQAAKVKADVEKIIQEKKEAKAAQQAQLKAEQQARKAGGHVTYKDPETGKYVSGTPEEAKAAQAGAKKGAGTGSAAAADAAAAEKQAVKKSGGFFSKIGKFFKGKGKIIGAAIAGLALLVAGASYLFSKKDEKAETVKVEKPVADKKSKEVKEKSETKKPDKTEKPAKTKEPEKTKETDNEKNQAKDPAKKPDEKDTPTKAPDTKEEPVKTPVPAAENKGDDTKPAEDKKPEETKPADTKPAEDKKPEETKPSEVKPGEITKDSDTYKVVKGDNVWNIAKKELTVKNGQKPTNAEIAKRTAELLKINDLHYEKDNYVVLIYPDQELKLK